MPGISVKLTGSARRLFTKGRAQSAVRRSSRKAASTSARDMRSEAVKVVRESKRIKAKAVRKAVIIKRNKGLKVKDMNWGVNVKGTLIRLGSYPARRAKKAGGVSVEINRGKRSLIPGAFIATMKSGHKGVFKRDGDERLPINEPYASRPLDVLKTRRSTRRVKKRGRKSFQSTYKRVLKPEVAKAAR